MSPLFKQHLSSRWQSLIGQDPVTPQELEREAKAKSISVVQLFSLISLLSADSHGKIGDTMNMLEPLATVQTLMLSA